MNSTSKPQIVKNAARESGNALPLFRKPSLLLFSFGKTLPFKPSNTFATSNRQQLLLAEDWFLYVLNPHTQRVDIYNTELWYQWLEHDIETTPTSAMYQYLNHHVASDSISLEEFRNSTSDYTQENNPIVLEGEVKS